MNTKRMRPNQFSAAASTYACFVEAWNRLDGVALAAAFARCGVFVGFDGTEIRGQRGIEATFLRIFADHARPALVAKLRWVRPIRSGAAVVCVGVGMAESGELLEAHNALQCALVARSRGEWRIEHLQTTLAGWINRPAERAALTNELRAVLQSHGPGLAPLPRAGGPP
jgi:uncharacterized protein (TIGR02246 family)